MIVFSFAFLLILVLEQLGSQWISQTEIVIIFLSGAALAGLQSRSRELAASVASAALLLLVTREEPPHGGFGAAPDPWPVEIEGIVSEPGMNVHEGALLRVFGGPRLLLEGVKEPPLPGTRVRATGRLEPRGHLIRVFGPMAFEVLEPPPPWHVGASLERIRRIIRERLTRGTEERCANLLRALFLGDRTLPSEDRAVLIQSGTLHLFAVSGMHLVLLLGLLRRSLGPSPRILLAAILFYSALTGFGSPVGRALLTTSLVLIARILGKAPRPRSHFLLSLVVLLAWDRNSIQDPGLILSYSAYAGILFLALPEQKAQGSDPFAPLEALSWRRRLLRWVLPHVVVDVSAFAASALPTVLLFRRLTWAALLGTILLTPVINILLGLAVLMPLFPGQPQLVFAAETLTTAFYGVSSFLARSDLLTSHVATPNRMALGFHVVMLVVLASPFGVRRRPWIRCGLLLGSTFFLLWPEPAQRGITLLDAGRGLSILVQDDHEAFLVDTGPPRCNAREQLLSLGTGRVDGVILTHVHQDHVGALSELRSITAGAQVFAPFGFERILASPHPKLISRGARISGRFPVYWPRPVDLRLPTNDRSMVIGVESLGWRVLIPSDLESQGLTRLLEAGPLGAHDVLVLPHHGARNSALADLVAATSPGQIWLPATPGFASDASLLVVAWSCAPLVTSFGTKASERSLRNEDFDTDDAKWK